MNVDELVAGIVDRYTLKYFGAEMYSAADMQGLVAATKKEISELLREAILETRKATLLEAASNIEHTNAYILPQSGLEVVNDWAEEAMQVVVNQLAAGLRQLAETSAVEGK